MIRALGSSKTEQNYDDLTSAMIVTTDNRTMIITSVTSCFVVVSYERKIAGW